MFKITTPVLLLIATCLHAEVSSEIRLVEIFPSGAAVTRAVTVSPVTGGAVEVEVGDLPSSLLASSIQIAPVDAPELRVGGFVFLPNKNPVKEDDPRTAELREAVHAIEEQLRQAREEKALVEQRMQYFSMTAESIRKSLEEEAGAEGFALAQEAWAKVETVRAEGEETVAGLTRRINALEIERQEAQKDLNERVDELQQRSGALRFDVTGAGTADLQLLVRYQVRQAGWNPVHEIRAKPATGTVEWIYKARIWQNSGEDWEQVSVTLNSASALHAGGLPDLDPLYLERMEARPMARGYSGAVLQKSEMAMMDMAPAAMEAERQSTTTGFFMKLPEPLSLESNEPAAVRTAFSGTLQAEFWSEAVPALSTEAWLMAGMTNELGWPILAGESYAYIDGQLVARRPVDAIAAGEEVEFALGRNEKIAIERKERVKEESEGGLIDKTKRHEIKYETTVENRMPVAHRVVLQDRFPIGRDNKIQVRRVNPRNVEPEEGTGLFKWERTIGPGEQAVMITEYSVIYPAEWSIYPPL